MAYPAVGTRKEGYRFAIGDRVKNPNARSFLKEGVIVEFYGLGGKPAYWVRVQGLAVSRRSSWTEKNIHLVFPHSSTT